MSIDHQRIRDASKPYRSAAKDAVKPTVKRGSAAVRKYGVYVVGAIVALVAIWILASVVGN